MRRFNLIMIAICSIAINGCSDDEPTAAECEQIEDRDACWDAGCGYFSGRPATIESDGTCYFSATTDYVPICMFVEETGGEDLGTVYFRDSAPDRDIREFPSNHGELKGWTKCEAAGRGQACGCTL